VKEIRAPSRQFKMGLSGPSVVLVLAFLSCFLPYLTGKSDDFIKKTTCQQVVCRNDLTIFFDWKFKKITFKQGLRIYLLSLFCRYVLSSFIKKKLNKWTVKNFETFISDGVIWIFKLIIRCLLSSGTSDLPLRCRIWIFTFLQFYEFFTFQKCCEIFSQAF
jgi:hypothetical protein